MFLYLFIFILLFVAELAYFKLADHFNIIDKPNQRSSHSQVTLRGGGIIFYIGVLVYFAMAGFQYPWFFTGLTLITAISFADDVKPQSSRLRLGVHFVSMLLMFYQWNLYSFPLYFVVIALVLCTGILNAYNFMDGINGITGIYSLGIFAAFWYINTFVVPFIDSQLLYIIMLALFVFNFFNFRNKAKCFAGDVGSISIAFTVVYLLGLLILKTNDFSYIILLAVYGVDSVLTIFHRIHLKENIFEPHRKHLFQLMANEMKLPHLLVSSIYVILQTLISIGFLFVEFHFLYLFVVLILLSIVYLSVKKNYYHLHQNN